MSIPTDCARMRLWLWCGDPIVKPKMCPICVMWCGWGAHVCMCALCLCVRATEKEAVFFFWKRESTWIRPVSLCLDNLDVDDGRPSRCLFRKAIYIKRPKILRLATDLRASGSLERGPRGGACSSCYSGEHAGTASVPDQLRWGPMWFR